VIKTEYAKRLRTALEHLLVAATTPGSISTADHLSRAEYHLERAEEVVVLEAERDLLARLTYATCELVDRNDEALALFARLEAELSEEEEEVA
jgi:hypothetical protein